jgi:nicotinate-nucleotide pyrophosphorylase (carboxylating)
LGDRGDVTSAAVIPEELQGKAVFLAKAAGVVAGLPAAELVMKTVDANMRFELLKHDGDRVTLRDRLATVSGSMRSILAAERTALNFLQHLSGIATLTRVFANAAAGSRLKILDTRKTLPGWRSLEKYAVRCGGGHNHRMGLYDAILVKDNHLEALGADKLAAIETAIKLTRQMAPSLPIEVEVNTLDEFNRALSCGADIILLDNMTEPDCKEAVRRRNRLAPRVQLEVSGNVHQEVISFLAEDGIDRVSIGAITHSAPAFDISLEYESR